MGMRKRSIAVAVAALLFLAGCTNSAPVSNEPLRGWDGELVDSSEVSDWASDTPEALPLLDEQETPEIATTAASTPEELPADGWINPDFTHRVTAAGTRLIGFGPVRWYTPKPPPANTPCPQIYSFSDAQQNATVDANVYRGTQEMTASGGADGTLLHAHAISFNDASLIPGYVDTYSEAFLLCESGGSSAELVSYDVDGVGPVDVIHVYDNDVLAMRVAVTSRANIFLGVFGWVAEGDEAMYDEFLADALDRLNRALFEEEPVPDEEES